MLIGVEKRFVFVANSKTASTSIERALTPFAEINRTGSPRRKHIAMKDVLSEYHFLFERPCYAPETFFKFGVMRDPFEWLYSWFRYRQGNKVADSIPQQTTFEAFWRSEDWMFKFNNGEKRTQQSRFLDLNGNALVDVIIPYSQLSAHFSKICNALDTACELSCSNVSNISRSPLNISAELMAEIREFYALDYALMDRLDDINSQGYERLNRMRRN